MLERENIDNFIADDLALRNRNWGQIEDGLDARYTKDETDGLLAGKADLADSLTMNNLAVLEDVEDYSLRSNGSATMPILDEAYGNHRRVRRTYTGTDQRNDMSTFSPQFVENIVAGEDYVRVLWVKPEESVRLGLVISQLFDCPADEWTMLWRVNETTSNQLNLPSIFSEEIFSPEFTPWIEYKDPMVINLTDPLGTGNEYTAPEIVELIDLLGGSFYGEITVPQKTLAMWTLNMIRQNRNAIIELGGTII